MGVSREKAETLQYLVNVLIEWVDDSVVYGKNEDWRVPENRLSSEYGLLQDDCDGYMSKAMEMAQDYPAMQIEGDIAPAIMAKIANDLGVDNQDICMFFVHCEPSQGNVDGTPPRGGHAVLLLRNEQGNGAYVIDNRTITYDLNGRGLTYDQMSEIIKLPLPEIIKLGYATTFVRTMVEAEKFGYLFMSGKVLGDFDWTVFENPRWQFVYPIMKRSQAIARDEGI